jgi:hypothetical protein
MGGYGLESSDLACMLCACGLMTGTTSDSSKHIKYYVVGKDEIQWPPERLLEFQEGWGGGVVPCSSVANYTLHVRCLLVLCVAHHI